jgi:hypothetical protein
MKTLKKCIPFVLAAVISMCVFTGCISGFINSELPKHTTFSAAEGSKKIPGSLKISGKEITLPCTISDLKKLGFDTDNKFTSEGAIRMWPADNENGSSETSYFYACLSGNLKYENDEKIKNEENIAAIKFSEDNKIDFELEGISFGMTADEFIKILDKPAYERDYGPQGYGRYYEGTNGSVYRFMFGGDKTLWSVMIATPEYIDWEINYLYHT